MTAPYKKRAQSGYNRDKQTSNRSERSYNELEIKDQLKLEEKKGSKVKIPPIDKETKRHIHNLRWAIKISKDNSLNSLTKQGSDSWFRDHYNRLYREAQLAIPFLKEKVNSPNLPNKVKKQINELLDQLK